MQKENSVVLTGTYTTTQITATFEKQVIRFASKARDGSWKDGELEIYIKPELVQQTGIQNGDTIKLAGFMVFNFMTKRDGTEFSFPKVIVTEIREIEKPGAQQQAAQPQQEMTPPNPNQMSPGVPPMPGTAPTAPQAPTTPQVAAPDANQAFAGGGVPPVPPVPGQ
jgi:hypothetical protein